MHGQWGEKVEHNHFLLDDVGQVIINDLKILKKKHQKKESELKFYKGALVLIAAFFLAYVLLFTVLPYRFHYSSMISVLINDVYHYVFVGGLATIHYRLKFLDKKAEKAEKEYNALRSEVIQRTEELWPKGEKWNNRHRFLKEMKEKHDINLYYEND
ncbi:MAG TPA: DUF2663 family protein [Bacillales bacterium]|nr:DUF2663 family protein [Bacillales bacterium]